MTGDPDVLKVRVHAGYESAAGGKRKAPRRVRWGARKRGAQIWAKILLPNYLQKHG